MMMKDSCALGMILLLHLGAVQAELIEVTGTASQTTEWNGGQFPAGLAVDGNPTTFSHTDTTTLNNGWELLFDEVAEVVRVEVAMREDCCGGRMTGVVFRAFDEEGDSVYSESLVDPGIGNTVGIELPAGIWVKRIRVGFENGGTNPGGSTTILHIGEVRVFAEEDALPEVLSFTSAPGGEGTMLTWTTAGADEVKLYPGGSVVAMNGGLEVTPEESTIYTLEVRNGRGRVTESLGVLVGGGLLPIRMNEVVASNSGSLVRSDGSTPDWIELWNPNPVAVEIGGYGLSDDAADPRKFVFPATTLEAGGYLVVDAVESGVDGVLALGFQMGRAAGGMVILSEAGGGLLEALSYPRQVADVSYGVSVDGTWQYFKTSTPGRSNGGEWVAGFVADTRFSLGRGFYESAQVVEVTSATPGAQIYVTTDGSKPVPGGSGAVPYAGPLTILGTTVLRAAAYLDGWEPTDVDTQTYLFAAEVAGQSDTPAYFPPQWVPNLNGVQAPVSAFAHYGMNGGIPGTLPLLDESGVYFDFVEALKSVPTMSLVVDADELFDPINGLHVNAQQRGRTWEREASIEVIDPRKGTMVQANCGLRMHGGWNRFPEMLKKSFRLYFRSEYGDSKLDYPLFEDSEVDEFDRLILRSGNGKAWASPWRALAGGGNSLERVMYLRDQFVRELQGAMGGESIPGNFVHLYINGHYWGLYNPVERPTEHFAAARYGGDADDYDVIKWQRGSGHRVSAGNEIAWNELMGLVRGNVTANYGAIAERLDLVNFTDYLLVNFFSGNGDWVDNNVYAMRKREGNGPFRFYCWDSEESWLSVGADITEANVSDTCAEIHRALRGHPEYRMLFADRVQKHLFNGGALTSGETREVFDGLVAEVERAIVGESARWGELLRPANPYGRDHWLSEVVNQRNNYLGARVGISVNQMKADGLYPAVKAPTFSPQRGSLLVEGSAVILATESGTIYYTLDGSDPRLPGGAIAPGAIEFQGGSESEEVFSLGSQWKYLDDGSDQGSSDFVAGAAGFDGGNWKHPEFDDAGWSAGPAPLGYGGISGATIATVVSYGTDLLKKHRTTYFRKSFQVTGSAGFAALELEVMRDDGVVVYLNGIEVGRSGFGAGVTVDSQSLAVGVSGSGESQLIAMVIPVGTLREGENVFAVELHQASDDSSDLGFDLRLRGDRPVAGGRIDLMGDTMVRARVLDGGEWSALDEARYFVGDRANEVRVSEMMFHPEPGGAEFLELVNLGNVVHRLDDLRLTGGIQFDFRGAGVTWIAPGERLVLVRDGATFAVVYPATPIAGSYDGALGNGGDEFSLEEVGGAVLWTLRYEDQEPWPSGTDGGGRSLVYLGGALDQAGSWRPSLNPGGNPGSSDRLPGGVGTDLLRYGVVSQRVSRGESGVLYEVMTPGGADGVELIPQWSGDLKVWENDGLDLLKQEIVEGRLRRVWLRMSEVSLESYFRVRLRVK